MTRRATHRVVPAGLGVPSVALGLGLVPSPTTTAGRADRKLAAATARSASRRDKGVSQVSPISTTKLRPPWAKPTSCRVHPQKIDARTSPLSRCGAPHGESCPHPRCSQTGPLRRLKLLGAVLPGRRYSPSSLALRAIEHSIELAPRHSKTVRWMIVTQIASGPHTVRDLLHHLR